MDKKKIEELYKANYRRLYFIARSIIGNDEESHDAVNEAFAKLLSKETDVAEGDEAAFLTVCVRNICLNTVKSLDIRERFARMCFDTQCADNHDDSYWKDTAAEVMDIVDSQFTDRMRLVFRLRFVCGFKYEEIAAKLGVARMTVYNDLLRIVDLIKKNVEMP